MALLVSLICFAAPSAPVQIAAVKHFVTPEAEVIASDAQCCDCPCWDDGVRPPATCGCSIVPTGCSSCGYWNIVEFGIPWGPFALSDEAGCIDMDALPVPQDRWVYWVSE